MPPVRPPNPVPAELAKPVRMVIFDVDGVLTDGGVYVGRRADATGRKGEDALPIELKRFSIQDGLGMKMLMWAGIEVAVISGRVSAATAVRMAELGVAECHQVEGARKMPAAEELLGRKEVAWEETAMLADDIPDLALLEKVGLRAAVGNAVDPVWEMAHWRSKAHGGHGAAREFTDELLRAQGKLDGIIADYVKERS